MAHDSLRGVQTLPLDDSDMIIVEEKRDFYDVFCRNYEEDPESVKFSRDLSTIY